MKIVEFYCGRIPDHAGRLITDIWAFDHGQLEYQHDFIQWLFPLEVPSPVNPLAPTLDAPTIHAFRQSAELRDRLLRSFDLMLTFYGLARQDKDDRLTVELLPEFPRRAEHWLRPGDHNHLRITRILRCLTRCGLEREAQAFLERLLTLAQANPRAVSPRTLEFWRGAVAPA